MTPTRVVFTMPTYGPTESASHRSIRAAIMHAASSGVAMWVGDLSPERQAWTTARNTVVQGTVQAAEDGTLDGVDGIFWCDSDIVLPTDGITRLLAEQKDFITGIYVQRVKPHWPLIANYNAERDCFNWLVSWPENVVAPIDGCGFGCVYTSLRLLKAMTPPWFTFEKFSEDFDFCRRAARAGFQLFVHTGVQCGHLRDPEPARVADFLAVRDSGEGLRPYETRSINSAA